MIKTRVTFTVDGKDRFECEVRTAQFITAFEGRPFHEEDIVSMEYRPCYHTLYLTETPSWSAEVEYVPRMHR